MRTLAMLGLGACITLAACSSNDTDSDAGESGGSAGASGSSGVGGAGGSSGWAGSAGSGATSGSAGAGANAGSAGSAGSAGTTACSAGSSVLDTDFEDGTLGALWVDGDASISTAQAHSGSNSARYVFSGAGHFGLTDLSAFDEVYVEMWVWLDDMPCVSGCDPAGKHFFRFAWWPDKNGGIQKQIDTGLLNGDVGAFSFGFQAATVGEWKSYDSAVKSGSWQRVRTAFRANAPSSSDGRFVWMFDDSVVLDLSGQFVGSGEELDTFMFTNYDIKAGDGITQPAVYIDDWSMRTGPGTFDCIGVP